MMMMNGEATEAELFLNCADMSVLERQRAHLNYHHYPGFFSNSSTINGGDIDGFLASAGLDLPVIYGETTVHGDARISVTPGNITTESGNFKKRKFGCVETETKVRVLLCSRTKTLNPTTNEKKKTDLN